MFYKEFDLASYRLRFQRQWVVFRDKKTKKEFFAYVQEITEERWMLSVVGADGRGEAVVYSFEAIEPKYHYIAPGFYPGLSKGEKVAYVRRKLAKTFGARNP